MLFKTYSSINLFAKVLDKYYDYKRSKMVEDIVKIAKPKMEKVLESFREDLQSIHSGKASSALVENIKVDHYNAKMLLKELASISTPQANLIVISPWDKGALNPIESALRESDLNINPSNDGSVIRINLPPMSEERRKEFVKIVNGNAEQARISIRTIREDAWKEIQQVERKGEITQDDKYRGEEKLNDLVKEINLKIEESATVKEKELLTL